MTSLLKSGVGKSLYDLDTPCLIVDLPILQGNLHRLQRLTSAAGLALRPHVKTHKCREIARLQLQAGAIGATVAKVSEAEVFAQAGVEDLFLANQMIGAPKLARLAALARWVPRLHVAVDSVAGAEPLSQTALAQGVTFGVILEVDGGAHRCGVLPEDLLPLAERVAALPGLEIRGLFAYAGPAYDRRGAEELAAWAAQESAFLSAQAARLGAAGHRMEIISGGCTPTAGHYLPGCGLTEIRPGTYTLNDRNQMDLGSCTEAQVAATVLTTVISTPTSDRALLDAGAKAIALQAAPPTSPGCGWLHGHPEGVLYRLNDEHGFLDTRHLVAKPRLGDKLRIIPPRIPTCVNLHDQLYVVEDERVVDVWPVAARGTVT
jgi:D-serine deaminase-like pyridoxal phosphate-dependent protein